MLTNIRVDSRATKLITHAIYPTLTICTYTKILVYLPITKSGYYPIIIGWPWIKEHEVIINKTNNFLAFWLGHCIHIGAVSPTTLSQPRSATEIAVFKVKKIVTL